MAIGGLNRRAVVLAALIGANLVPLWGVLFLQWNVAHLMFLYWGESAIIGLYTVLKMASSRQLRALFLIPFFIVHFGIFMLVHFVFIAGLFLFGPGVLADAEPQAFEWAYSEVWIAFLILMASHGVSFWVYFVRRAEVRKDVQALMFEPYPRIVVMQITIIFGAFLLFMLGSIIYALILWIALKIAVDVVTHLRQHNANVQATDPTRSKTVT